MTSRRCQVSLTFEDTDLNHRFSTGFVALPREMSAAHVDMDVQLSPCGGPHRTQWQIRPLLDMPRETNVNLALDPSNPRTIQQRRTPSRKTRGLSRVPERGRTSKGVLTPIPASPPTD